MDKLAGIAAGDRVRVVCEGVVAKVHDSNAYPLHIDLDGRCVPNVFHQRTVNHPSFSIEKLQPELKVGDRFTWGARVMEYVAFSIDHKQIVAKPYGKPNDGFCIIDRDAISGLEILQEDESL